MEHDKVVIIAAITIAAIAVAFAAYQFLYFGGSYNRAVSSELPDKCATPPGYTDASWREHMGHHPDQYAECLK